MKTDFGTASILSFTDDRKKEIIFHCEHSSNECYNGKQFSQNDTDNYLDNHWGYDIKAFELARDLTEHYKTYLIYATCRYCLIKFKQKKVGYAWM